MRKYEETDERKIRVERLVREWLRSGLLDQAQHDLIATDLETDLRRTNLFLRVILFGFGILIITALVLLIGVTFRMDSVGEMATLCFVGAVGCFALAECLTGKFRLYRFGVEEAAAMGSAALLAIGSGFAVSSLHSGRPGQGAGLIALVVGSAGSLAIYLRFGYVYAASASMLCAAMAPFLSPGSAITQRLIAVGVLAVAFAAARSKRQEWGGEFPGDEYGAIQAIAWAGVYAFLNLQLLSFERIFGVPGVPRPFYWFTYGMVWLLPVIGLYLGLRDRDRALLDVNLGLGVVTLTTNKPYLGAVRETWDPILLGVLLIGMAVVVRRWLSNGVRGFRHGFTASRLLSSDKRQLSVIGTASAALPTVPQAASMPPADRFEAGGGRSGGGGASGSFWPRSPWRDGREAGSWSPRRRIRVARAGSSVGDGC